MTNFGDFWGKVGDKRSKNKKFKINFSNFFIGFKSGLFAVFTYLGNFFKRVGKLPLVLNKIDKIALAILLIIFLGLIGFKINRDLIAKSKKIPNFGGNYKSILIGEAKYLNPILAKTDTDKTINQLIYSGLTKIDPSGNIVPDLAKNWEISADGKIYTFHLKEGISWQDGIAFSSADVQNTISQINNSSIKSPYYETWKDVEVEAPDQNTVVFKLKNAYGPFIYNTLIGIIPSHVNPTNISSSPVGTGRYKFVKAISGKNKNIEEVMLKRSESYYDPKPYIEEVDFKIAADESAAKKLFDSWSATSVSGLVIKNDDTKSYGFQTSRYFGLVFNLANDKFKDLNLRKKIKSEEKFDPAMSFSLLVLDKPLSVSTAENLKTEYAKRGINIVIDKKGAIEYTNLLSKKNFEVVLYGFDSGYDRDPYPFWHTSQVATGDNFSSFSNKAADILLEDARMTTDSVARNQKYDQFFAIFNEQVPAIFLPNQQFQFSVSNKLKGVDGMFGYEPQDHLNSFANWYLKTKRVKP